MKEKWKEGKFFQRKERVCFKRKKVFKIKLLRHFEGFWPFKNSPEFTIYLVETNQKMSTYFNQFFFFFTRVDARFT